MQGRPISIEMLTDILSHPRFGKNDLTILRVYDSNINNLIQNHISFEILSLNALAAIYEFNPKLIDIDRMGFFLKVLLNRVEL